MTAQQKKADANRKYQREWYRKKRSAAAIKKLHIKPTNGHLTETIHAFQTLMQSTGNGETKSLLTKAFTSIITESMA